MIGSGEARRICEAQVEVGGSRVGCCLSAAVLLGVELYGEPILLGLKHLSWELKILASGRVYLLYMTSGFITVKNHLFMPVQCYSLHECHTVKRLCYPVLTKPSVRL